MTNEINSLVKKFNLQPHPEGGFYRETYRAEGKCGERNFSTAIYFLLTPENFSAIHRIKSDEIWHFYSGDPITVVEIENGCAKKTIIGNNLDRGEVPQYVVPAGNWFGSYLNEGGQFAFVGCTVSPGFEFQDFELGNREELVKKYPKAKEIILKLTKE